MVLIDYLKNGFYLLSFTMSFYVLLGANFQKIKNLKDKLRNKFTKIKSYLRWYGLEELIDDELISFFGNWWGHMRGFSTFHHTNNS